MSSSVDTNNQDNVRAGESNEESPRVIRMLNADGSVYEYNDIRHCQQMGYTQQRSNQDTECDCAALVPS